MQQHTLHIAGGVARNPLVRLSNPVTLDFLDGEHIAIVGPNGAGKSLLVDLLTGKYPLRDGVLTYDFRPSATQTAYDNIKYIAFRDTYGSADANYYYQQRWNAHDQEDAPLVRELLGEVKDEALRQQLFGLFRIEPMLDKKIILLSSGELRKFQLTKTLLTAPRILIMDNPFIGLDAATRELVFNVLKSWPNLLPCKSCWFFLCWTMCRLLSLMWFPLKMGWWERKWNVPPICGLFVNGMLFVLRQMPLLSVNCSSV